MQQTPRLPLIVAAVACLMGMLVACSTQKNTASSRWWHAFNARYNTYYNGKVAYIEGALEQETGHQDDYTQRLPLYIVENKDSRALGKGQFTTAVTKAQKAIHQHSIKRRPVWDKQRKKTAQDWEWLQRKEYNPFLWKAWMLMGRAQFHMGNFEEAAATFAYMNRLYATQPAIYGKARAWLAKTYTLQGWLYDAEEVMRSMQRDSMDWRAVKDWDYAKADYYLHRHDYRLAAHYLNKVVHHELRRKQKARTWYVLGQVYAAMGERDSAYRAFAHVTRMRPTYELELHARIAQTEVAAKGQARKMTAKLQRMAASENNRPYLGQIYYAKGNILLAEGDTAQAIRTYEEGNRKALEQGSANTSERGNLLWQLGNLYWQRACFVEAQPCYSEALGLIDRERPEYAVLENRSKVLDELVPHLKTIALQDSLQQLVLMDESQRLAAIDRVIDALKEKEKKERRQQDGQEAMAQQQQHGQGGTGLQTPGKAVQVAPQTGMGQTANKWYFYNPMAVSQGKEQFQKLWGKRENVDNWRRVNQTVVAMNESADEATDAEQQGSTDDTGNANRKEARQRKGQVFAANDPHQREYYLAQLPFTPAKKAQSDSLLCEALLQAGVLFKDKLDALDHSERLLLRLVSAFPSYSRNEEAYYHLYLLYGRQQVMEKAATYLTKLQQEFPHGERTKLLTNPYYEEDARWGVQREDSLYAATYTAFKENRVDEVEKNALRAALRYPQGANRDKFLFLEGMVALYKGLPDTCVARMETLVAHFPQSALADRAGMLVNGVKAGRQLRGEKGDMNAIWQRRKEALQGDTVGVPKFVADRNAAYSFVIVYPPDSVPENRLLYELARYNFTNFLVRNFELTIDADEGLHRMTVSGFRNFDEGQQYAHLLMAQQAVCSLLKGHRFLLITPENLALIGKGLSYDDYADFYQQQLAPWPIVAEPMLDEPLEITTRKEVDKAEPVKKVTPQKAPAKKKKVLKLEDEYYELEGF